MIKNVYINLPVADVAASERFFAALGLEADPAFSDERTLALRLSETVVAMLLRRDRFAEFTDRPVADASETTAALVALQLESRAAVDAMFDAALAAGGAEPRPAEEHGFMYGRAFSDPDGHIWEPFWFDAEAAAKAS
ncbi:MAG: VOC family protein [Pseudomonadota bacterium]